MGAMAYQITSLTIVYSTVYSGADQRKHQSSASLAFVRGIHRWSVNSPHRWQVTRKMFPFDDVIMVLIFFSPQWWCHRGWLENLPLPESCWYRWCPPRHCLHVLVPSVYAETSVDKETPGPRLNIKTVFPRYGDSHVKDKTVARHGDPYTGKTTSLYWDVPEPFQWFYINGKIKTSQSISNSSVFFNILVKLTTEKYQWNGKWLTEQRQRWGGRKDGLYNDKTWQFWWKDRAVF